MAEEQWKESKNIFFINESNSSTSPISGLIEDLGFQIQKFHSIDEAYQAANTNPPNIIFTQPEIANNKLSYLDLIQQSKKLGHNLKLFTMSTRDNYEDTLSTIDNGAFDVVTHPQISRKAIELSIIRALEIIDLKDKINLLEEKLETAEEKLKEKSDPFEVNKIITKLSKENNTNKVIQVSLEHLKNCLNATYPILFFKNNIDNQYLELKSYVNFENKSNINNFIHLKCSNTSEYVKKFESLENVDEVKTYIFKYFNSERITTLPFISSGKIIGFLFFLEIKKEISFRNELYNFLSIVQSFYYTAIMHEQVKALAIKDPLTNLYNRRFFNQKIDEEIVYSKQTHYPLSIIYLDIDHFKIYNDKNGHPAGDKLLILISKILRDTARKSDIVARMGGEEFCLLLPHTNSKGALIIAERIRSHIELYDFEHKNNQPLGKITVSIGISEYPSISSDAEDLIKKADLALYYVKEKSRNATALAKPNKNFVPDFLAKAMPQTKK